MKRINILLFLVVVISAKGVAESPHFALHLSNPLTLFQKTGVKVEFRSQKAGVLFFATQYYGSLPDYPGTQVGIEGRRYLTPKQNSRREFFFYGKVLGGHQQEREAYGEGFFNHGYVPEGYYYGAGAGVGTHINFNHFFIEFNGGLKGVLSTTPQESAFYITGPASVVDLRFNVGYQF